MTQDEIIEMARRIGFGNYTYEALSMFETFAKLVAQHEREACAQFIETEYVRQFENPWRDDLSAAIRARSKE